MAVERYGPALFYWRLKVPVEAAGNKNDKMEYLKRHGKI